MGTAQFSGNPRAEWLAGAGPDREMRLLEPFSFVDPNGCLWEVGAGTDVNGASIPRTLWSSVGSPYTGDYRRAAILHDAAIRDPLVVRAEADAMFYQACLAGGCAPSQAKLLYAGVRVGSWMSRSRPLEHAIAEQVPDAARLPGQHSPLDLEVRALYTLLAGDLRDAGDDIDSVRAAVDRRLGEASGM